MATLRIATPFGRDLVVESDGERIVASTFHARSRTRSVVMRTPDALLHETERQVAAYLARTLRRFELPLGFTGTPFQCAVWECVTRLEFGEVVSYADIARAIAHPLSHRGVAMAMGKTPLALFIPAHRVIGADGRVKGAGADSMRRRLLAFEGYRR